MIRNLVFSLGLTVSTLGASNTESRVCGIIDEAAFSDYSQSGAPSTRCRETVNTIYVANQCNLEVSDIKATLTARVEKETLFRIGRLINIGGIGGTPGASTCSFQTHPIYSAPPRPLTLTAECTFTSSFEWFCGFKNIRNTRSVFYQDLILEALTDGLNAEF